jgi:hypothetical protein
MAKIKRKSMSKEERKKISERMTLLHAQRREAKALAAGAEGVSPAEPKDKTNGDPFSKHESPTILTVNQDGIVKVLMPADVLPQLPDGIMMYKIGKILVSVRKI